MEIEVIRCPVCGGSLEQVNASGFYTCPYCGSRMRVTLKQTEAGGSTDGGRVLKDPLSGQDLCYVKLPHDWCTQQSFTPEMQSSNWPYSLIVQASGPDNLSFIYYHSGASYKEIVQAFMTSHRDGVFDQTDMMPMYRFKTPSQYIEAYVANLPALANKVFLEDRPFPKNPPEDFLQLKQALYQNTQYQLSSQGPMAASSLTNVFYDGLTRVYQAENNSKKVKLAVATVIDGTELSVGGGMFGVTRIILWESQYLIMLQSPQETFEKNYAHLVNFCSSLQASPFVLQRIESERSRLTNGMLQRQQQNFNNWQNLHQQQQAAYDSYNQAWMDRSQSQHNAAMAQSYQSQSAEDRILEKWSEAIRGVNTYIRPDGTEVEYEVINEKAYANANDNSQTFATQSFDFNSVDWVEMKKKN